MRINHLRHPAAGTNVESLHERDMEKQNNKAVRIMDPRRLNLISK